MSKSADWIPEHEVIARLGGGNDPVFRTWWVEFERNLTRVTLPGGLIRMYSWPQVLTYAVRFEPGDPERTPLPRPAPEMAAVRAIVAGAENRLPPPDPLRRAKGRG